MNVASALMTTLPRLLNSQETGSIDVINGYVPLTKARLQLARHRLWLTDCNHDLISAALSGHRA